jgi:hypothetical protein
MYIEPRAVAGMDCRNHVRLPVNYETYVTDHRFVENRLDRDAIVVSTRWIAVDARARCRLDALSGGLHLRSEVTYLTVIISHFSQDLRFLIQGIASVLHNVYFNVPEVFMIDTRLANHERFSPSTIHNGAATMSPEIPRLPA